MKGCGHSAEVRDKGLELLVLNRCPTPETTKDVGPRWRPPVDIVQIPAFLCPPERICWWPPPKTRARGINVKNKAVSFAPAEHADHGTGKKSASRGNDNIFSPSAGSFPFRVYNNMVVDRALRWPGPLREFAPVVFDGDALGAASLSSGRGAGRGRREKGGEKKGRGKEESGLPGVFFLHAGVYSLLLRSRGLWAAGVDGVLGLWVFMAVHDNPGERCQIRCANGAGI